METVRAARALPPFAAVIRERSRRSLRYFLESVVWPAIEPSTPFVPGWHLDAMCEHGQAVVEGEVKNLLINIAPRHTKSLCMSVALPTWTWLRYPELRFLTASYIESLAMEHAVLSRRVIESPLYQALLTRDPWEMTSDQNVKTHYENDRRGYRIAVGVRGAATGKGGDILLIDDPHNTKEVESVDRIKEAVTWYRRTWSTRHNTPKDQRNICVAQRAHLKDLSAWKMENESDLEHLNLPTEYDPKRICVLSTGWSDPRSEDGELLNPERFGDPEVDKAKETMGPTTFETQHNQRGVSHKGGYFKRAKLTVVDEAELLQRLAMAGCRVWQGAAAADIEHIETRGWDFAATDEIEADDPDFTAGVKMRRYYTPSPETDIYVAVHCTSDRWGPADGDTEMKNTAVADGYQCRQREEVDPGQAGKRVIAGHATLLHAFDYAGVSLASKNKVQRATPLIRCVDAGRFYILKGDWDVETYREVMARFDKAPHDDEIDASSCAYNDLAHAKEEGQILETQWG